MRLEQWCIVASVGMIVSSVVFGMKFNLQSRMAYTRFCYNQMVDSALEDGLLAGIQHTAAVAYPEVDNEAAMDCFKKSLMKSFDISEETADGKRLLDCLKCTIIIENEYATVYNGTESFRVLYKTEKNGWNVTFYLDGYVNAVNTLSGETVDGNEELVRRTIGYQDGFGKGKESVWRDQTVSECISEAMEQVLCQKDEITAEYIVDFPIVEEDWCHNIRGVSMISFWDYGSWFLDGHNYDRYLLSGARVVMK